jgi:uncharacterized delta-60 repeat protein
MKKLLSLFCFLFAALSVSAQVSGMLDATFGTNGRVTTPIITINDVAAVMVIQDDGKIIVAGGTRTNDTSSAQLVRYNVDGTIDKTFGENGRVALVYFYSFATALALQSDGKILVGGYVIGDGLFISRYNSNGSIDSTCSFLRFKFQSSASGTSDKLTGITVQADGKIVTVGTTVNFYPRIPVYNMLGLARFTSLGSSDYSFGNYGKVVTEVQGVRNAIINDVALQADNKILVCGYKYNDDPVSSGKQEMIAIRYNTDGSIDNSFAINGIASIPKSKASRIRVLDNQKIVIAGNSEVDTINHENAFALYQYKTNGTLDNTFGINGRAETRIVKNCAATDMIVQKDGKILLVGAAFDALTKVNLGMVRYNSVGALDNSFGINGRVVIEPPVDSLGLANFRIILQNDGKIVLSNSYYNASFNSNHNSILSRYTNAIAGVGVDKSIDKNTPLSIFPNPTNDVLNIDFKNAINNGFKLSIADMSGRILFLKNYNKSLINNLLQINIFDFTSGLYLLTIATDKGKISRIISKK